ncbi:MAG: phosphoadenosine phosphosulfate reductase family protein [Verrucomicrobia bacterium]|nr:phosphoadenosine phosphosulfate reductase family protein [Verrucomicrobiota bacterium]
MDNHNPSILHIIGFSGGKDSVATWLHLTRDLALPNVLCAFADTGHESPVVHEYMDELVRDHGLNLVKVQPIARDLCEKGNSEKTVLERLGVDSLDAPIGMKELALVKQRFPSATQRFCTERLKLYPMRRWQREKYGDQEVIRVSGVRAQESAARADRPVWSDDEFFGCKLWLPIHQWTHDEVFAKHKEFNIPINPLYLHGFARVGCFPCIMSRKPELAAMARRYPEAFDSLRQMEIDVAAAAGKPQISFFSATTVPPRFSSHKCPNTSKPFPDALDVKKWAEGEDPRNSNQYTLPIFEEDHTEDVWMCSSQYGLCE